MSYWNFIEPQHLHIFTVGIRFTGSFDFVFVASNELTEWATINGCNIVYGIFKYEWYSISVDLTIYAPSQEIETLFRLKFSDIIS